MQEAQIKLGKKIRQLREKKGLSQEFFAGLCDINRVHMSQIERGLINLTMATLHKLAQNLDMTVSELLKGIL
jgi:transcriptional regulator with XRE-family HTH domain